ncbi:MAG: polysaccharide lyase 6 family protein [Planctomycetota bacterium]
MPRLSALSLSLSGCAALHAASGVAFATEYVVSSAAEIQSTLGDLVPGDALVLSDGIWTDQLIRFIATGTEANPITLRAQTPGRVVLNGDSRIELSGAHLVVEGLRFEGGALAAGQHVVRFKSGSTPARNSVLRDTAIIDYNPDSELTRYFWVSLHGTDNVVENCVFQNQFHSGVVVTVWDEFPNRHIIRNNYFLDMPEDPQGANGWETIRIGSSANVDLISNTVVESNLFERCDGEIEIISSKTGDCFYRYNTFLECKGTLTLRHGFGAEVQGNFFLGNNRDGSGGVRVVGPGHRVWNNYFEKLGGRTGAVIALYAGEIDGPDSGYLAMDDVVVAHNTIVDCEGAAFDLASGLGTSNRTVLPMGVTLLANLISSPAEDVGRSTNNGVTWLDNMAYASGLGTADASGVSLLGNDPLSVAADGLERPTNGSPGVPSAQFTLATDDMDGDPRGGSPDIGADQVTGLTPVRAPLTPDDVGPSWYPLNDVPPGGAAIATIFEAEDFDHLIDPDNDGVEFTIETIAGASNDAVLKSPDGSRSDSGDDETIASYELRFPAAGDYTAYYLARGFSGSSDSFFEPSVLGAAPTDAVTTSSNGVFAWERGNRYTVASTSTTSEFRIGRREQDTEIDAVILHPDDGLDALELDALLGDWVANTCDADVDRNTSVDFFDTILFLEAFDSGDLAADLSGDGSINRSDALRYLVLNEAGCGE